MELLSTGETATRLGITRDALICALRSGAPEPERRIAGRRMFGEADMCALSRWFDARGRRVNFPRVSGGEVQK